MAAKAQTSEQRRRAIVTAARAAFLRHGYGNTSMSAIAAKLGGSKTTLWTYFRNKRELYDAVVDDLVERYGEALRLPLPPEADPREVLQAFALSLITTVTRPQIVAMHRMVTGEAGLTPGTMAEGLDIPANTLSFHLKELVNAGLVTQERASRHLIYRARYDRMNALLGYLTDNCCQGAACTPASAPATCCN